MQFLRHNHHHHHLAKAGLQQARARMVRRARIQFGRLHFGMISSHLALRLQRSAQIGYCCSYTSLPIFGFFLSIFFHHYVHWFKVDILGCSYLVLTSNTYSHAVPMGTMNNCGTHLTHPLDGREESEDKTWQTGKEMQKGIIFRHSADQEGPTWPFWESDNFSSLTCKSEEKMRQTNRQMQKVIIFRHSQGGQLDLFEKVIKW